VADPFDTFLDEHWRCGELERGMDYDGNMWTIWMTCSCGAEFVRSGDQCPLAPGSRALQSRTAPAPDR
jgi:hypothetical protein